MVSLDSLGFVIHQHIQQFNQKLCTYGSFHKKQSKNKFFISFQKGSVIQSAFELHLNNTITENDI